MHQILYLEPCHTFTSCQIITHSITWHHCHFCSVYSPSMAPQHNPLLVLPLSALLTNTALNPPVVPRMMCCAMLNCLHTLVCFLLATSSQTVSRPLLAASVTSAHSFTSSAAQLDSSLSWNADTGASAHMTCHHHWMHILKPHHAQIRLADRQVYGVLWGCWLSSLQSCCQWARNASSRVHWCPLCPCTLWQSLLCIVPQLLHSLLRTPFQLSNLVNSLLPPLFIWAEPSGFITSAISTSQV